MTLFILDKIYRQTIVKKRRYYPGDIVMNWMIAIKQKKLLLQNNYKIKSISPLSLQNLCICDFSTSLQLYAAA